MVIAQKQAQVCQLKRITCLHSLMKGRNMKNKSRRIHICTCTHAHISMLVLHIKFWGHNVNCMSFRTFHIFLFLFRIIILICNDTLLYHIHIYTQFKVIKLDNNLNTWQLKSQKRIREMFFSATVVVTNVTAFTCSSLKSAAPCLLFPIMTLYLTVVKCKIAET